MPTGGFVFGLQTDAGIFPKPNWVPTTWRQVKAVLGVPDHDVYLRDACGGPDGQAPMAGCSLFPFCKPGAEDRDEVCPCCRSPRYKVVKARRGSEKVVCRNPRIHVLPFGELVQSWFSSKLFCNERSEFDRAGDEEGIWGGAYFKRVNAARGGTLLAKDASGEYNTLVVGACWEGAPAVRKGGCCSAGDASSAAGNAWRLTNTCAPIVPSFVEVGSDGVTARKFSKKNMDVVCVRPLDLPPETRGRQEFSKLLVLRGDDAVKSLRPYLSELREVISIHAGAVDPVTRLMGGPAVTVFNAEMKKEQKIHILWLVCSGDTPKYTEMANAWHTAAYLSCLWCCFTAIHAASLAAGRAGMYMLGYSEPQEQNDGGKGVAPCAWCMGGGVVSGTGAALTSALLCHPLTTSHLHAYRARHSRSVLGCQRRADGNPAAGRPRLAAGAPGAAGHARAVPSCCRVRGRGAAGQPTP